MRRTIVFSLHCQRFFICHCFIFSGKLLCECTTIDCQLERRRSCEADYFCYVENINSELTRGCINDKTPLLCENRKPSKLPSGDFEEWPFLFCCKTEDYCNREVTPVKPTEEGKHTQTHIHTYTNICSCRNIPF